MFDFARPEDVDALKDLWLSCFGGPREYVDFYYSRRFLPEDTLVWREGGRPVSMMTLMRVRQAGEDGAYVYAVATSPEYRGRGLMTRLDAWSREVLEQRGAKFSALVPAGPELFPMYQGLGYRAAYPVWVREVRRAAKVPVEFTPCTYEEFRELRRRQGAGPDSRCGPGGCRHVPVRGAHHAAVRGVRPVPDRRVRHCGCRARRTGRPAAYVRRLRPRGRGGK